MKRSESGTPKFMRTIHGVQLVGPHGASQVIDRFGSDRYSIEPETLGWRITRLEDGAAIVVAHANVAFWHYGPPEESSNG